MCFFNPPPPPPRAPQKLVWKVIFVYIIHHLKLTTSSQEVTTDFSKEPDIFLTMQLQTKLKLSFLDSFIHIFIQLQSTR